MVWESPACRTHLTVEELAARGAVEDRIRAALATLEPACWSWDLPTPEDLSAFDAFDGRGASSLELTGAEVEVLRRLRPSPDVIAFDVFHNGRCAICGDTDRLVQDHDHSTGMIRGKLCRSCNTTEGFSHLPLFEKYRTRNPASILGVRLPYTGIGWEDGVPVGGWPPPRPGSWGSLLRLAGRCDSVSYMSTTSEGSDPADSAMALEREIAEYEASLAHYARYKALSPTSRARPAGELASAGVPGTGGYINQWGWPAADVTTACGGTIASTLVTRRPDLVRCERCLAAQAVKA